MTKIDSAFSFPRSAFPPLLFVAVVVFVYFFGLTIPLLGPDESRYSQVAREMFERGDWITPTLGGFHWFEKPALLYWLQIAAYSAFGISEFAARVGSALFGLGTVLSLWILGCNLSEPPAVAGGLTLGVENNAQRNKARRKEFANWLGLIAASSIGVIVFSRGASFDIILTFPITAALVSFYIFDTRVQPPAPPRLRNATTPPLNEGERRGTPLRIYTPLFAFYFFIGVALLAKGLVGIVFPFAIVGFYYLLSWRFPNRAFIFSLVWGTIVSVAVASAWYLPMYQRHGWGFIDEFFIQHHFQRYTSNKYFHPQPFYFFFWVLPLMTIPWLPFFAAAIWDLVRNIFHHRDTKPTELMISQSSRLRVSPSPLIRFSLAWLLVPVVFFSFSGSKLPGYILPALPPALIISAICVFAFIQKSAMRARLVQAMGLATFVVVVALILFVVPRFADADSVKGLIAASNENGYNSENVLTLHVISHNAEFYAPGRLLRDNTGKQKKLLGTSDVLDELRRNGGKPALVLVPLEYLKQLLDSPLLQAKVLKDNGELAIVYVQAK